MTAPTLAELHLKTYSQIGAIEAGLWDQLGSDQGFQSYRWYAYAEKVMADCAPHYILVFNNNELVARAAFYLVRSEPLPIEPEFIRAITQAAFRRWPLFICRTPLAGLSGLALGNEAIRSAALNLIGAAALAEANARQTSFVFFDFVEEALRNTPGWPSQFRAMQINEPGTFLALEWPDFDSYLAALGKEERYHYRRIQRKAQELGITVSRCNRVAAVEEALALIRNVERKHSASPVPWTQAMLEHLTLADGTWLEARIGQRLVGCGLSLRDNGAQINTALGLAEEVPYVYFALLYESLRVAFEHKVRIARLGSGAYDVKRRLGFQTEDNNYVMAASANPWLQKLVDRMAK